MNKKTAFDVFRRRVFRGLDWAGLLICGVAAIALVNRPVPIDAQTGSQNGRQLVRTRNDKIESQFSQANAAKSGVVRLGKFEIAIPDFVVQDQNGKHVRFYSDLIKNKVVVLGFFYAKCSYVCEAQGRNFAALQSRLGRRLGREVFLISVTRTPIADTPAKLKAWAKRYGVRQGWTLITGETKDIGRLVASFAQDSLGPQEMHAAPILIGNDATGSWVASNGLITPEQLAELIGKVSAGSVGMQ